eukprot:Selendium_serpulae@DN5948_c0_g2_i1.p1
MGSETKKQPTVMGFPMKYVALFLLIVQTVAAILLLRLSRTVQSDTRYISTTAVLAAEILKVIASFLLVMYESEWSFKRTCDTLKCEILGKPLDTLLIGVPSGLYVIQNNLIFVALSNINGALYQVTYQLKILTTAVLSVMILSKVLGARKWGALFLLTIGVALIQIPTETSWTPREGANQFVGICAVLAACVTSGFAGVFLEKMLKGGTSSIWVRNIQLATFGTILATVGVMGKDGNKIREGGFFQGYSMLVWAVICIQALGGLIVATVLKFADNILKCFGNAVAIVLSCLLSWLVLNDFIPNQFFAVGTCFVIAATYFYTVEGKPTISPRKKNIIEEINESLEEKGQELEGKKIVAV